VHIGLFSRVTDLNWDELVPVSQPSSVVRQEQKQEKQKTPAKKSGMNHWKWEQGTYLLLYYFYRNKCIRSVKQPLLAG
jgi:hypothetical protein